MGQQTAALLPTMLMVCACCLTVYMACCCWFCYCCYCSCSCPALSVLSPARATSPLLLLGGSFTRQKGAIGEHQQQQGSAATPQQGLEAAVLYCHTLKPYSTDSSSRHRCSVAYLYAQDVARGVGHGVAVTLSLTCYSLYCKEVCPWRPHSRHTVAQGTNSACALPHAVV